MHKPSNLVGFDTAAFWAALDRARTERGLTWRDLGNATGVGNATFTRIGKHHHNPDANNLAKLLHWLGDTDMSPYIKEVGDVR